MDASECKAVKSPSRQVIHSKKIIDLRIYSQSVFEDGFDIDTICGLVHIYVTSFDEWEFLELSVTGKTFWNLHLVWIA